MSSYHKPKTYRSLEGCCICKAKSSSSRFTDSDKYEDEFENCFLLASEERSPKILKKMKKKKVLNKAEARVAKIERGRARRKNPEGVRRRLVGEQRSINNSTSGFIDFGYWRRMESCCGPVYVGQLGEVMVEQSKFLPCAAHNPNLASLAETAAKATPLKAPIATSFVPVPSSAQLDIDSDKSFIDEDEDTDSMSFYSDTDSSVSKTSKNDVAAHTDDEGFEGLYDKTFKKNVRIKEMFGNI